MITSASASSDGGEEEGGAEEGGGEDGGGDQGGEVEDAGPQETDTDAEADDAQQSPAPETSPPAPLAIDPTLMPAPTSGFSPPGDQTLKSICIINPNLPQCQSTSTSIPLVLTPQPTPTPVLPQSLCIINPNHPDCRPASRLLNFTPSDPSVEPQSLCIINPNHPDCPYRPLGRSSISPTPPPTPGSQSSTLQSQCIINPNQPQCQTTQSNIGDLALPSSPDTLFSGPKSAPGGSVPLRDPALVPGPDEEGVGSGEPCIAFPCFPYPLYQDEICRNEKDDDFDGKVDETVYCTEVPGESKPRPSDGILTEIPGSPLGPPQ